MNDDSRTVVNDFVFLLMTSIIVIVVLLIVMVGKKSQDDSGVKVRSTVIIEISWQDGLDVDVDLWASDRSGACGFTRPSSRSMNLVRDDLGRTNDPSLANFEIIMIRSEEGEYKVSVVLYNNKSHLKPVVVRYKITISQTGSRYNEIASGSVVLRTNQQEVGIGVINIKKNGWKFLKNRNIKIYTRQRLE